MTDTVDEEADGKPKSKKSVRARADAIKPFICRNLIAVIENPSELRNIGTVIRIVNAFGVEKVYVVDPRRALPDDWQDMRERPKLSKTSVQSGLAASHKASVNVQLSAVICASQSRCSA